MICCLVDLFHILDQTKPYFSVASVADQEIVHDPYLFGQLFYGPWPYVEPSKRFIFSLIDEFLLAEFQNSDGPDL